MTAAAGSDRRCQDEHIAMNLRRDPLLMTCFQGDKEEHPLVQAIMFCYRWGLPTIILPCNREWSAGYVRRVLNRADPGRAGLIVPVPDDRSNQAVRLFDKHIRLSAGAMDMEDLIDLDEELRDLLPGSPYTVCVQIGPELLRKRPELRRLAGYDDSNMPSQLPASVSARLMDVMLVIAEPERPPT